MEGLKVTLTIIITYFAVEKLFDIVFPIVGKFISPIVYFIQDLMVAIMIALGVGYLLYYYVELSEILVFLAFIGTILFVMGYLLIFRRTITFEKSHKIQQFINFVYIAFDTIAIGYGLIKYTTLPNTIGWIFVIYIFAYIISKLINKFAVAAVRGF